MMTFRHKYVTLLGNMAKKAVKKSAPKTSKKIAGFEPTKVALLVAVTATVSIVLFTLMAVDR